uniref:Ammonium transporter n=1 Tax=Dibaeis baeomyces TaxID=83478 RepID=R4TZB0_9LECA|nr:high-affinity ammonium transporter [Dibaeis baeomyces]
MATAGNFDVNNPTAPSWLIPGDNAWQLTAGSLVGLQSIPGLVILYAGWVKHKWAINSAFMAFYGFAMTLLCWVVWGYKMSFGYQMLPFVGYPAIAIDIGYQLQQSVLPTANLIQNFPQATMVYFQFVFAAITIILVAGSYLCRMNFAAWMLFVPLWMTFSYTIGAFSIWGGGFLYQLGVIDYSGGYVIHLSSGTAGFVGAWWIGPRLASDRENSKPSNITLMLAGAGILWTGWNGFNGGDPYSASPDAGVAVLNTNICTATSLLCWTAMDMIFFKKPSVIGAVQGMITGLVAITPAAGVVAGWGAILLGLGSGVVPWITMNIVGKTWFFRQVDDTLEVFHTHFVGAIVGGIGTGLWATEYGCLAFGITNPGGAIAGNGKQVWLQIVGALFVIGWNIVWTSLIMIFIKYVCRIPLRMSEELLEIGDYAIHGEEPYTFEYYNRSMIEQQGQENPILNDAEKAMSGSGASGSGVIVGKDPQLEKPADIHASGHGIGSMVKQD